MYVIIKAVSTDSSKHKYYHNVQKCVAKTIDGKPRDKQYATLQAHVFNNTQDGFEGGRLTPFSVCQVSNDVLFVTYIILCSL